MILQDTTTFQPQPLRPFGLQITANRPSQTAEIPLHLLSELALEYGLVILRGFHPPTRAELLSYCQSEPGMRPLEWNFGPVMEMKEQQDPQNYLFSRERVPFHWDGAFHQVPDFLVFSCVEAPVSEAGGETLFTNTELIFNNADGHTKDLWKKVSLKYDTQKKAHYGGSVHGPLLQTHPVTKKSILRFAEPVETELNPVTLEVSGLPVDLAANVVNDLVHQIYEPGFCYSHQWQAGDLLIADNHALIHGRTAFQKNCPRHLRRIQLLRE